MVQHITTTHMVTVGFRPKVIVKRLLSALPERSRVVIEARFGLGKTPERLTLETIGNDYGITRERVRQIENHSIATLRKSPVFKEAESAFKEMERIIDSLGGIVCEDDLLSFITKDKSMQNHIYFLLVLGDPFTYLKEDGETKKCWYVDPGLASKVQNTLQKLYANLTDDDLIPESEMIERFLEEMKDLNDRYRNEEIARRWLSISKKVGRNPLGEWGVSTSPNVKTKGIRDYAYLAVKRHGSPLHFKEVAELIEKLFKREAHVATCHNELIKDPRFVLVGRGIYALREWGYASGVVRDVIRDILKKEGALTRDEVVSHVLKERHVKENTILVNLQNQKYFKKGKDGRYALVK